MMSTISYSFDIFSYRHGYGNALYGHGWQALPLWPRLAGPATMATAGRPSCHYGHGWQALPLQSPTQAVGSGAVARYLEVFKLLFLAFQLIFTCFCSLAVVFSISNSFELFEFIRNRCPVFGPGASNFGYDSFRIRSTFE